jgi:hypothetical protein
MLKHLRVAFLLYVLLFVAVGEYLTSARSKDWNDTLWVAVYPINGDGKPATQQYLDNLAPAEFIELDRFFVDQSHRYGLQLDHPFRFDLRPQYRDGLPQLDAKASMLGVMVWSLRMRWQSWVNEWAASGPAPDIVLYAVYFAVDDGAALDRSTALRKGMIAVANVFASSSAQGSNRVVMAHELLHTLGATDKYDLATTLPLFPDGYAAPDARPLLPQKQAELMGGRVPISKDEAVIPESLAMVAIGPATAREIGWPDATR